MKIHFKASRNQQRKRGLAAAPLLAETTMLAFKYVPRAAWKKKEKGEKRTRELFHAAI